MGRRIKPGRVVEDFVNVRDLAPTYMELAGLAAASADDRQEPRRHSPLRSLRLIENRDFTLAGKERHDSAGPTTSVIPSARSAQRISSTSTISIPSAGPPATLKPISATAIPAPRKKSSSCSAGTFTSCRFGKRLPDELYRITDDPECVRNLANDLAFKDIMEELRYKLMSTLKEEGDPRALGKGDEIFDTYQYTAGRGKGYETWLAQQEAGALAELAKKLETTKKAAKGKKAKASPD